MIDKNRWFTADGREVRTEHEPYVAWFAYLADEYDGAPDAGPQLVGEGTTEEAAIADLNWQIEERKT